MVSEANTLGRHAQARRVFHVSLAVFLTLGVLSFLLMWWGNDYLAGLLHNSRAAYGIRALAPAVICVGCLSAFRGYAQGCFHMTPTAVSQIIEAACKLFIGLALALWLLRAGYPDYIAAAGAILGVTIGTILSLVYMAVNYLRHRPPVEARETCDSSGAILRRLLAIAVPITLSSSMVSIITLIDTSLVQGRLQSALQYTLDETRALYGNYSACMDLYNLPSSLMVALTASVIPAVSAAITQRNDRQTARIVRSSFRVTALLAFPMGLGLWALSGPIFRLFYPRYDGALGGQLLAVLGIASIFVCLMLVTNSILQSYGRVNVPIVTMLIGGVVKIVLNYNLVAIPSVNIHGAPIASLVCYTVSMAPNLYYVVKYAARRFPVTDIVLRPLAATLAMGAVVWLLWQKLFTESYLSAGRGKLMIAVIVCVAAGIAVYVVCAVLFKAVRSEDLPARLRRRAKR